MLTKLTRRTCFWLLLLGAALPAFLLWPRGRLVVQPESNLEDYVLGLENGLLTAMRSQNWTKYAEYVPPSQRLAPGQFVSGPGAGYALESWKVLDITPARLPGPDDVSAEGYAVRVRCFGTHPEDRGVVVEGEFTDFWGFQQGRWYRVGRR